MNEARGSGIAARDGAPRTILIVDDVELSAAALELACSGIPGVDVKAVSSALEAVRILDDQNAPVCAIFTDILMPVMDGFELIRFIRSHRRHAMTPVIVVTADTDLDTQERTSRMGANAYFGKPFSPRAVRRALEQLLYVHGSSE